MLQEKEINIDSINTAGLFSPGNMHPLGLRVIGLVNGCLRDLSRFGENAAWGS
jgi:hypothetical protein